MAGATAFGATALAAAISLYFPMAGQLCALLACILCAARLRSFFPVALAVFAHSAAIVTASRMLDSESSDFVVYFQLYRDICAIGGPTADTLLPFGYEVGLSSLYHVIAYAGGCGLTINGLAYVQGLLVGTGTLALLCGYAMRDHGGARGAVVVGGTLVLFSFIYVTQLSRQCISSAFLLAALLGRQRRMGTLALLAMATAFHLTAPVIFLVAKALRSASPRRIALGATLAVIIAAFASDLLLLAIDHADVVPGLVKLAYYADGASDESAVGSDIRALLYLTAAGLLSLGAPARALPDGSRNATMLLGLAALSLALLNLPLAATRVTLAFSGIAIGYFLFAALVSRWPRLSVVLLIIAIVFRSGLSAVFAQPDQTLWTTYPWASATPLYYISSY